VRYVVCCTRIPKAFKSNNRIEQHENFRLVLDNGSWNYYENVTQKLVILKINTATGVVQFIRFSKLFRRGGVL